MSWAAWRSNKRIKTRLRSAVPALWDKTPRSLARPTGAGAEAGSRSPWSRAIRFEEQPCPPTSSTSTYTTLWTTHTCPVPQVLGAVPLRRGERWCRALRAPAPRLHNSGNAARHTCTGAPEAGSGRCARPPAQNRRCWERRAREGGSRRRAACRTTPDADALGVRPARGNRSPQAESVVHSHASRLEGSPGREISARKGHISHASRPIWACRRSTIPVTFRDQPAPAGDDGGGGSKREEVLPPW